ncbi:MAG TPA: hypothetical protein VFP68_19205 [Burkholderiaceae bacterium]|nr:hypothetical protein [Burkholderiaceae bacterium]
MKRLVGFSETSRSQGRSSAKTCLGLLDIGIAAAQDGLDLRFTYGQLWLNVRLQKLCWQQACRWGDRTVRVSHAPAEQAADPVHTALPGFGSVVRFVQPALEVRNAGRRQGPLRHLFRQRRRKAPNIPPRQSLGFNDVVPLQRNESSNQRTGHGRFEPQCSEIEQ